jgi:hypothetical protein
MGWKCTKKVMNEMMELMKNPQEMKNWFESKRMEFDSMPEYDYVK